MSTEDEKMETAEYQPRINEITQSFLEDLKKESSRLPKDFPLCALLIEEAFERVFATGRIPGREIHADVLNQKPIKLTQKVFIPIKQYPKFNFIGKILGPKGNSLARLQDETQCKITIRGRNSMRDKAKEEELRNSDDPRYGHLHKDLYVEISTVATPAESYARIAYALAELRKYLIPDKNDDISHEQLREIMEIDPDMAKNHHGGKPGHYKSVFDKAGHLKGTPRFMSLLKSNAEPEEVEEENHYEDEQSEDTPTQPTPTKRPSPVSANDDRKVQPSAKGFKRVAATGYADKKRSRGVASSK